LRRTGAISRALLSIRIFPPRPWRLGALSGIAEDRPGNEVLALTGLQARGRDRSRLFIGMTSAGLAAALLHGPNSIWTNRPRPDPAGMRSFEG
jgi:hypothetical protein